MMRSKKFLAAVAASATFLSLAAAFPAQAASLSAGQVQAVLGLLKAFGVDQTTMSNVEQALSGAQVTTASSTPGVQNGCLPPPNFGERGEGVKMLQKVLAKKTGFSSTNVTGYFGPLTRQALRTYQKQHDLSESGSIDSDTVNRLQDDVEEHASSTPMGPKKFCLPPGHLIAPGWQKHVENEGINGEGNGRGLIPPPPPSSGTSTPPTDTTPPVISNLGVSSVTTSSVTISWSTNESASGRVFYATVTPVSPATAFSTPAGSPLGMSQVMPLTGLSTTTVYYYLVTATDAAGNTATSSENSFTTLSP